MERVSISGLPASGRMAAWHDLYSARMGRVEFTPADLRHFDAELCTGRLGPVQFARLAVDHCSIERTRRHLGQSPRMYSFMLQSSGSSVFRHCGHESRLSPGDFVLCDTGMPHLFYTAGAAVNIMVRVTPDVLREHLPSPEQFCGLRLGKAIGMTPAMGAMVRSLGEQVDIGSCRDHGLRIGRYLLEMVALCCATGFDHGPLPASVWRWRNEVLRYIEEHLHDPFLDAESVADGVHLSSRHLRSIFAASGEKLSGYILRRRLEECARKIRDPAWGGQALRKIAFSLGFNSAAHFTRAFRGQFGVSPREYRKGVST